MSFTVILEVLKLHANASLPSYTHEGDSGLDLRTIHPIWITERLPVLIETGLAFKLPPGYEMQIRPRSGLSALGYTVAFGTIDNGYRGQIRVCMSHVDPISKRPLLWNADIDVSIYDMRKPDFEVGAKVAQAVLNPFVPAHLIRLREVQRFTDETSRGEDGFGSTDSVGNTDMSQH